MNKLINKFPIQVTTERLLIHNETQLYNFINSYNGKTTLYYSLYDVDIKIHNECDCRVEIGHYHSCYTKHLNKICFDIDNINSLEIIKNMHKYLLKKDIKHMILFSGNKGFHLYIFTINYHLIKNRKNCLLNATNYFIKELNLKIGIDIDNHIVGDINRLMRIPNTQHMTSKFYCIPITTEDLILGKEHIIKKAKQQNFKFVYYGSHYFDISSFDKNGGQIESTHICPHMVSVDREKLEISIDKQKLLNELTPCLQNLLVQPYIYWRQRFHVLKNLLGFGYSDDEIDIIMKTFLEGKKHPIHCHDNYQHYLKEKQLSYVKKNKSLFSCDAVKRDSLCPIQGLCDKIQEKPIYL